MSSPWQEGCLGRCQDCASACPHIPGLSHEEPYKRFMTIGPVRYGMRVGAVSPPPPGAGPRYRSRTCCWPAAAPHDTTARIPLLPTAPPPINSLDIISCANRTEDASTSEQTQTVRDHVPYPGGRLLNKRCALVYSRLVDVDHPKDEIATLDRLPRFRFGGNRAEKRGSDKFRELTERLKRTATSAPVPPPRRHTRTTPPPPEVLAIPQRTAPFPLRSASFSQVDYCSDDNKYVRRTNHSQEPADNSHNTLPRPKTVPRPKQDAFTSTTPVVEQVPSPEPLAKEIPEVQITSESPEKTVVRPQDSASGSTQDRRRDKSRRRKGIYLSQWPTDLYTNDVENILPKYEEEDSTNNCDSNNLIISSSPQEEPLSPDDSSYSLEWPAPATTNNNNNNNNNNKDSLKITISRSNSLLRSDSLSEGEPDNNSERRFDQISLVPSDVSDCESRLSASNDNSSPSIPRRYSKRPLRGPYGQMLEAEMKKPESRKNINSDLKFLEDLSSSTSGKSKHQRRGCCNSSIDETFLKDAKTIPITKRKVSADNLVVEQLSKHCLVPNHQRTTSSPSKLEGLTNTPEVSSELLEQLLRGSSEQLEAKDPGQQIQNDTRTHVLIELFDNERIYVESLEIIVVNYWEPLKKTENAFIEQSLVEELFSQIPFLLNHHRNFLLKLKSRLETCESPVTIGDIFLEMLTAPEAIDNYVKYVNNWKRSRDIIKAAQNSKPQFVKFLENASKNNVKKLALDALLIKPIQKYPKYELLLQRLLKYTSEDHPDYELLTKALKEVHEQLIMINCTEKEPPLTDEQSILREIEAAIENGTIMSLLDKYQIRCDNISVTHSGGPRKDRSSFLAYDTLFLAGAKRKSGTITKKSNSSINSSSSFDGGKQKVLMRIPLQYMEIIRGNNDNVREIQLEVENINEDITVLNKITVIANSLHCNHSSLDDVVKELVSNLNKQLQQQQSTDMQLCTIDLSLSTATGVEILSITFPKLELRLSWEDCFNGMKAKYGERRRVPELISMVPIRKTRAGLQFTCAAPTLCDGGRDVWVCNSDGYVGQVCILTLNDKPEPTVTSCNGVCNTRILCIISVPGPGITSRASSFSSGRNRDKLQTQKAMQFDSCSSSEDESKQEEEDRKSESLSESSSVYSDEPDKLSTMWLGTEDGCIHIYNSNDNIRIKKNKIKLQLGSSVLCIVYMENRVFASQDNGHIQIYERDGKGGWNTNNPKQVTIGNSSTPVSKMVVHNSRILCACGNTIIIFNPNTLERETAFVVISNESHKPPQNPPIACMLLSGNGLWVSLQNSAIVKCFNVVTYEMVCEASVASAVQKMLTSCDDIIRQHKAACLRVTALIHSRDLLWIGTSAGVLLNMQLPHVASTTSKLAVVPPVSGVHHGHTGHVRILTSIQMPFPLPKKGTPSKKSSKGKLSQDSSQSKTIRYLVISGGDGYEDFRTTNQSEVAGREDSTNHLLLWST